MDWLAIPIAVMTGMAVLIWVAILVEHGFIEYLNKRTQYGWRRAVGIKTIKIELRYMSEPETDKALRTVARKSARELMAVAMLITTRHPQIALSTEESFEGEVELSMQDEEE
jgi:hypothetical protein